MTETDNLYETISRKSIAGLRRRVAAYIHAPDGLELRIGDRSRLLNDIGGVIERSVAGLQGLACVGVMANPVDDDRQVRRVRSLALTFEADDEYDCRTLPYRLADLFAWGDRRGRQKPSIAGTVLCPPTATVLIHLGSEQKNNSELRKLERRVLDIVEGREFDKTLEPDSPAARELASIFGTEVSEDDFRRQRFLRDRSGIGALVPLASRTGDGVQRATWLPAVYIDKGGPLSNLEILERRTAAYFDSYREGLIREIVTHHMRRNGYGERGQSSPLSGVDLRSLGVEPEIEATTDRQAADSLWPEDGGRR